jgi:regulator of replication initiation timing
MEIERIEHRLVTMLAASAADIEDLKTSCQRMYDKMEHIVNENKQLREELHEEIQSRTYETRKEVVGYVERKLHPLREDIIGQMEHNNGTLKSSVIEGHKKQRNLIFLMFALAILISGSLYFLGQR